MKTSMRPVYGGYLVQVTRGSSVVYSTIVTSEAEAREHAEYLVGVFGG